jgi:transposase InsO family protein
MTHPASPSPSSPTTTVDDLPPRPECTRKPGGPFPEEIREYALILVASGMTRRLIAERIGCSTEIIRVWTRKAREDGTMPVPPAAPAVSPAAEEEKLPAAPAMPQRAPKDPGVGLGAHEEEAILSLKKRHPSMGPAQIRTQLKRFKGWRVSVRAIARVLKKHGYELVHTASRPKDEEDVRRWEAPHRNALWQLDFVELRIGPEKRALLLVIDDFSRFCVAYELMENPTSEDVVLLMTEAIRRYGKPEAIYTDRGGPFLAWNKPSSLGVFLETELIDHHVSPSYRPRGRGKIESLAGTVRRELWDIRHFGSVAEAEVALIEFFADYNHRRAHMGIDGLTPADRFHGRWEEVKALVEAASRKRQGVAAFLSGPTEDPFVTEEILPEGPFEVLRLMIHDGRLFLAFLGHRVDLGEVKP